MIFHSMSGTNRTMILDGVFDFTVLPALKFQVGTQYSSTFIDTPSPYIYREKLKKGVHPRGRSVLVTAPKLVMDRLMDFRTGRQLKFLGMDSKKFPGIFRSEISDFFPINHKFRFQILNRSIIYFKLFSFAY